MVDCKKAMERNCYHEVVTALMAKKEGMNELPIGQKLERYNEICKNCDFYEKL